MCFLCCVWGGGEKFFWVLFFVGVFGSVVAERWFFIVARAFHDLLGGSQRPTRWLTPRYIVDALGSFDLDPCGAPGHVLAGRTYQIDEGEDGLVLDWFGRVWCNPPYGREAVPFVERMVVHGDGMLLTFARTDTRMFQDLIFGHASALLFLAGRVRFLREDLSVGDAANAPSVIASFGGVNADVLEGCGLRGKFVRL